jgi:hypothetical protein
MEDAENDIWELKMNRWSQEAYSRDEWACALM